jgi:two-component system chemotaxis response regulator CheY
MMENVSEQKVQQTILVIDELNCFLYNVSSMLGDKYKVLQATNAKDSLAILAKQQIQLIMADETIDGISGITFISVIRKSPALAKIPVIFFLNDEAGKRSNELTQLGIANTIIKPITSEALHRAVAIEIGTVEDLLAVGRKPAEPERPAFKNPSIKMARPVVNHFYSVHTAFGHKYQAKYVGGNAWCNLGGQPLGERVVSWIPLKQ